LLRQGGRKGPFQRPLLLLLPPLLLVLNTHVQPALAL
jgi:hypothetical protein